MSSTYILTRSEREALYQAVAAVGLMPEEFSLSIGDSGFSIDFAPVDNHKISIICKDNNRDGSINRFNVFIDYSGRIIRRSKVMEFSEVVDVIGGLAEGVRGEIHTPDPWEAASRTRDQLSENLARTDGNTPFSEEEQSIISERMRLLAQEFGEKYSLTETQFRELDKKIEHLVDATYRLHRFDWVSLVIGVLFTHALAIALPADVAQQLIISFGQLASELADPTIRRLP